jgi:hypothetical protein
MIKVPPSSTQPSQSQARAYEPSYSQNPPKYQEEPKYDAERARAPDSKYSYNK